MNIICEPQVWVLSTPQFRPHPKYVLPVPTSKENPSEQIIAIAGKVCYDSYDAGGRSVTEHITNLVSSDHFSVLEHANFGVFIEGISRGCSHELVRHRHFSFSQRSTRYTAEDDAAIVLDPYYAALWKTKENDPSELVLEETAIINQFIGACEASLERYTQQVKWLTEKNPEQLKGRDLRKYARGKARQLLPHALETRLVMTGNIRSWREFFDKRCTIHAEAEIRRLANVIKDTLVPLAPTAFGNMG